MTPADANDLRVHVKAARALTSEVIDYARTGTMSPPCRAPCRDLAFAVNNLATVLARVLDELEAR